LPPTHVFEALRAAIYNQAINYAGLWYALIAELILFVIMAFFLQAAFQRSRKTGLLAKGD